METYGSNTITTDGSTVGSTQGFATGQLKIKSIVDFLLSCLKLNNWIGTSGINLIILVTSLLKLSEK